KSSKLWGLLIVHQCGQPRPWALVHQHVIKQIADHIGTAIRYLQQSKTLEEGRNDATQWHVAIETSGWGVWQWRFDADEINYSQGWQTFLGYQADDLRLNASTYIELIHPDDRAQVTAALNQHFAQQTDTYHSEHRLRCRDGRWQWVCCRGKVTERRADGTPLFLSGLILDISDRKQQEQEIEQQAQREHALDKVIEAICSSLNMPQVFEVAATQIAQCLQGRVRISQYLAEAACWRAVAIAGTSPGWGDHQREQIWADVPDEDTPITRQLKRLQTVQGEDTAAISRTDFVNQLFAQPFPGQWLIVPIAIGSNVWGAVALKRPQAQEWQTAEIELTQRIASQLAIAIHHADLHWRAQTADDRDALVLRSINEGIWDWHSKTGLERVSDRYWEMLGYTPPVVSPPLGDELQRVHPDDREAVFAAFEHYFHSQEPFQHELRLRHREGHYIWVRLRGKSLWDTSGQPVRMLGSVEDISDRKALDMQLRQQEKEFRTLVENNPDGVMRVNRQFRVVYANPIMASRMGLAQADRLGQILTELDLPKTLKNRWQAAIALVFETRQEQLLETQELLTQGEHTFYSRLVPEFDDQEHITSVLIISRNVTNLRAAQIALQQQADQEHTLRLITQHMRATLDLNCILSTAVAEVQRSLQADRTVIVRLLADQSQQVIAEAVQPPYPEILQARWEHQIPVSAINYFDASGQGRGRIVANIADDEDEPDLIPFLQQAEVKSRMMAPIIQSLESESILWGFLIAHACASYRSWQSDELNLLEKVAEQLAIAIQQSELHHRLQAANKELARLSTTDALTQIANRRSFDSALTQEWQRAQREQQELTLIFCDIDRFKHYNDTFGHPAGDACIATVAQALQQCVNRPNDCLARYGGEEFAIILPYTDLGGAVVIVEQMRAAIAERNIAYPTSQGHSRLTLSFGISTIVPQPHLTFQNLVYWADQALYQAKQSGRNGYAIVTGD
ncbi:MAG: diguanylate cyclase, partial [Cyanobacteria bacterium P01_H01_bin.153]